MKKIKLASCILSTLLIVSCSSNDKPADMNGSYEDWKTENVNPFDSSVSTNASYKIGNPYKVDGVWYYPHEDYTYSEIGNASWYGEAENGKVTANGENFNENALTAAHRTLPLPSYVRVTNLENGKNTVVRINDRGPFARDRIIDVSKRTAEVLGFKDAGNAKVRVEILAKESMEAKEQLTGKAADKVEDIKTTVDDATSSYGTEKQTISGEYFVQAGAFSSHANAENLKSQLVSKAGTSNVRIEKVSTGSLYKVLVGPYQSKDAAKVVADSISAKGFEKPGVTYKEGVYEWIKQD